MSETQFAIKQLHLLLAYFNLIYRCICRTIVHYTVQFDLAYMCMIFVYYTV